MEKFEFEEEGEREKRIDEWMLRIRDGQVKKMWRVSRPAKLKPFSQSAADFITILY